MARKTSSRKKQKLTPNQQLYKKELKRIQSFIKRAEKRGYQFADDVVPKIPKRVTKEELYKIKKLTPEMLYRKSVAWINGIKVRGTEKRTQERKQSSLKANLTRKMRQTFYSGYDDDRTPYPYTPILNPDKVIQDWLNQFLEFPNGQAAGMLTNWFLSLMTQLIDKYGETEGKQMLSTMIKDSFEAGARITFYEAYVPEKAQAYISMALDYLPFIGPTEKEHFEEMFHEFTGDDYNV